MGNTYEVYKWDIEMSPMSYRQIYAGESFFKAFFYLFWLKITGSKCVKFEWR